MTCTLVWDSWIFVPSSACQTICVRHLIHFHRMYTNFSEICVQCTEFCCTVGGRRLSTPARFPRVSRPPPPLSAFSSCFCGRCWSVGIASRARRVLGTLLLAFQGAIEKPTRTPPSRMAYASEKARASVDSAQLREGRGGKGSEKKSPHSGDAEMEVRRPRRPVYRRPLLFLLLWDLERFPPPVPGGEKKRLLTTGLRGPKDKRRLLFFLPRLVCGEEGVDGDMGARSL